MINTSEAQLGGVVGPAIIAGSGKRLPKPTSNLHQWVVDTSPPERAGTPKKDSLCF